MRVLRRRLVSVPRIFLALALASALLPALLLVAACIDARRALRPGPPPAVLRLVALAWFFLLMEVAGVLWLGAVWLGAGLGGPGRRRRMLEWTALVQRIWVGALFHAARVLFSLTWEIAGDRDASPGPVLVFIRHASLADVLLPTVFLTARHGLRLRFVLKRELLADPCLDIAGNRLPNCFVGRGGQDSEAEIAGVCALARGLSARDGVLIYPEGTRFTPTRRARALDRLRQERPDLHARAQGFAHVLPPRLGGPLALLDSAPHADVVFFAHQGLEGAALLGDIWRGGLLGRRLRMRLWRVPRARIPAEHEARVQWLYEQWQAVEDFAAVATSSGARAS